MHLLLKDLFRRRWWLFLIAGLLPFLGMLEGRALYGILLAFVVFYGPMMLFMFEASANSVRCCVPLPLGRRTLGRTIWVACMLLFPALTTPAWLAGEFLPFDTALGIPLLASGGVLCLGGIGWVLIMTVLLGDRTRLTGFRGLVWGLVSLAVCAPGVLGMLFFLHRFVMATGLAEAMTGGTRDSGPLWLAYVALHRILGPAERLLDLPNTTALVASLFCACISYGLAPSLLYSGLGVSAARKDPPAPAPARVLYPSRARAFLWPWLWGMAQCFYGVAGLTATFFVALGTTLLLAGFEAGFAGAANEVEWQGVFIVLLFPALLGLAFPWLNALRSLRALPLSRWRLTLLLVSFPVLALVLSLCFLAALLLVFQGADKFPHLLDWTLLVFGITLLGCGVCVRFGPAPAAVFLLSSMMASVALDITLISGMSIAPVYFHFATALVFPPTAVLGLYWLHRLITTSSAAYRQHMLNERHGIRVA